MEKQQFSRLQNLSKAIMVPLIVMPVVAIFMCFSAILPDGAGEVMRTVSKALLSHLGLLCAIGVSVGIAKEHHGIAGLSGAVGFIVCQSTYQSMSSSPDNGVLMGILMGLLAGVTYNKMYKWSLPAYLGFFSGRRLVPIVTAASALFMGLLFWQLLPTLHIGLQLTEDLITHIGILGVGIYGLLNRLLIPFGLHHVLNTIIWLFYGTFTDVSGYISQGEMWRFFAGDARAGSFMAGFYPITLFGLPAACLALKNSGKNQVNSKVLMIAALASFLTGITEPIEFLILFISPWLFITHAVITGLVMMTTSAFGILHGFGFSAGVMDYLLNFHLATKPLLILPIGIVTAGIYYFIFSQVLKRKSLRDDALKFSLDENGMDSVVRIEPVSSIASQYIQALGGPANLLEIDACITRLRCRVNDAALVREEAMVQIGAMGMIKPNAHHVHIVVGTEAEKIAEDIQRYLNEINE